MIADPLDLLRARVRKAERHAVAILEAEIFGGKVAPEVEASAFKELSEAYDALIETYRTEGGEIS